MRWLRVVRSILLHYRLLHFESKAAAKFSFKSEKYDADSEAVDGSIKMISGRSRDTRRNPLGREFWEITRRDQEKIDLGNICM